MGTGLDIGLDNVGVGLGNLGGALAEDDKLKRLEIIIDILNVGDVAVYNTFLC